MKRKTCLALSAAFCAIAILALAILIKQNSGRQETQSDNLPTIEIMTAKVNTKNFDGEQVSRALDEYVAPLIGAHVNLSFIEQEHSYLIYNQYATSSDMPDAFLLWTSNYPKMMYEAGKLMPLDDLLERYGQDILQTIEDKTLLGIHTFDGSIYAIPNQLDRAYALCLEYRVAIAEEYGLDMSDISSISDLTAVYDELAAKSEGIIPVSDIGYTTWDPLSDELGVLMDLGQSTQVVNLYETAEFRELCELIHLWNQKGFLQNKDSVIASLNAFTRSPEIFSRIRNYNESLKYVDSADANEEMECIIFSDTYTYTELLQRASWGIYSKCEYPEAAMKFINLMYSDPVVMNLLTYGIEGVHYEVIDAEKGIIDFPKGVTLDNSGYAQFRGYFYGNEFLTYVWNGYPEDLWAQVNAFNEDALRSAAYGFEYDPSPVQKEVRHCSNAVSKYRPLLLAGVGDVDQLLAQMNAELKEAGIDLIIQEKQAQLDAWLAQSEE